MSARKIVAASISLSAAAALLTPPTFVLVASDNNGRSEYALHKLLELHSDRAVVTEFDPDTPNNPPLTMKPEHMFLVYRPSQLTVNSSAFRFVSSQRGFLHFGLLHVPHWCGREEPNRARSTCYVQRRKRVPVTARHCIRRTNSVDHRHANSGHR